MNRKLALRWMDDLFAKSIQISGSSAIRERERFFRSAEAKIKRLTDKIASER
jgi:hypothetical protein